MFPFSPKHIEANKCPIDFKDFLFHIYCKDRFFSLLEARSEVFESMVEYLTDDFCPHVSLVWI